MASRRWRRGRGRSRRRSCPPPHRRRRPHPQPRRRLPGRRRRSPERMAAPPAPGDARFFARSGPHSLAAIAAAAGAEAPKAALTLSGVAPLGAAAPDQVSFIDNRRYVDALAATRAGAVIVQPAFADRVPAASVALVSKEPALAWARVAALFHPSPRPRPGVHPSAVV